MCHKFIIRVNERSLLGLGKCGNGKEASQPSERRSGKEPSSYIVVFKDTFAIPLRLLLFELQPAEAAFFCKQRMIYGRMSSFKKLTADF